MTEVMVVSGFLGAGKTTFINRYLECGLAGRRCLLIENDFGEAGVDAVLIGRANGLVVSEISAGCVCCSLAGNLQTFIREALKEIKPDRVILEPSGVARLSGILRSLEPFEAEGLIRLQAPVTVLGPPRTRAYLSRFGGILRDQMEHAGVLVLRPGTDPAAYAALPQGTPLFNRDWTRENFEDSLMPLLCGGRWKTEHMLAAPAGDLSRAGMVYYTLRPEAAYTQVQAEEILRRLRRVLGGKLLRLKGFLPRAGGGLWHVEYTVNGQEVREFSGSQSAGLNAVGTGLEREQLERLLRIEPETAKIRVRWDI